MKALIYNSTTRSVRPLQHMLRQAGVYTDLCQGEERFGYLAATDRYAAAILVTQGVREEIQRIQERWKSLGTEGLFVVLTANPSVLLRAQSLAGGVDRYFIEPYSYARLLEEIFDFEFQRGQGQHRIFQAGPFKLDVLARAVTYEGNSLPLTRREFDILSLLIRRRGTVLSRIQIWEEVWGDEEYPLVNTIDVHVSRLRKKVKQCGALIRTVHGVGYCMREPA